MINPIKYIKDVIDLVRNPPGEAVAACEITPENYDDVLLAVGPEGAAYIKYGDYFVEFETITSIVPNKDFHKHYAFVAPQRTGEMTPVRTIKPL